MSLLSLAVHWESVENLNKLFLSWSVWRFCSKKGLRWGRRLGQESLFQWITERERKCKERRKESMIKLPWKVHTQTHTCTLPVHFYYNFTIQRVLDYPSHPEEVSEFFFSLYLSMNVRHLRHVYFSFVLWHLSGSILSVLPLEEYHNINCLPC